MRLREYIGHGTDIVWVSYWGLFSKIKLLIYFRFTFWVLSAGMWWWFMPDEMHAVAFCGWSVLKTCIVVVQDEVTCYSVLWLKVAEDVWVVVVQEEKRASLPKYQSRVASLGVVTSMASMVASSMANPNISISHPMQGIGFSGGGLASGWEGGVHSYVWCGHSGQPMRGCVSVHLSACTWVNDVDGFMCGGGWGIYMCMFMCVGVVLVQQHICKGGGIHVVWVQLCIWGGG